MILTAIIKSAAGEEERDLISGEKEYPVLKGIDLKIENEDFIGIMGRSGCGKTTLLKILGTIDKPTRGKA